MCNETMCICMCVCAFVCLHMCVCVCVYVGIHSVHIMQVDSDTKLSRICCQRKKEHYNGSLMFGWI